MNRFLILLVLLSLVSILIPATSFAQSAPPVPILVELFTSEGCSSCPPADALLQELDRSQPIAGAQLIVLSEHVDYWNHIGWRDPYSSAFFSNRQNEYVSHFRLSSAYTPQMIVDGSSEFVGNDRSALERALQKARSSPKIALLLSQVAWQEPNTLHAHVEAEALRGSDQARGDVLIAVALEHAESQVLRGENEGRRLTHVAVVLSLTKIGTMEKDKSFSRDVQIKLDSRQDLTSLRLVAFVQERGPGAILGAAVQHLNAPTHRQPPVTPMKPAF